MKRDVLLLKLAVCLIGSIVLVMCIFGLPSIATESAKYYPAYLLVTVLAVMYLSALPFFFALYQALKLLSFISQNKAFSQISVNALIKIKFSAVIISVLYAAVSPFLYLMAQADDAPGILAIGLVICIASFAVAVFAAVLQKLLSNAIEIKLENDLTI